jgi:hypothetical protein
MAVEPLAAHLSRGATSDYLRLNWALFTSLPFWNIAFMLPPPEVPCHIYMTVVIPARSERDSS